MILFGFHEVSYLWAWYKREPGLKSLFSITIGIFEILYGSIIDEMWDASYLVWVGRTQWV
jgi:hypothetical protein